MKNKVSWLLLALVCVALTITCCALADDFESAYTGDGGYHAPSAPQQQQQAPSQPGRVTAGSSDQTPVYQNGGGDSKGGLNLAPAAPKMMPTPEAEDPQAVIAQGGVPALPAGAIPGELYVQVFPSIKFPLMGQQMLLESYVWNVPAGQPVYYQWQVERGFGWETIRNANGPTYEFTYNQVTALCKYRVCIDVVPFLNN